MSDSLGSVGVIGVWIGLTVCEIHGLYLAYNENFTSLMIAFFIPPWAIIKGLIGFF
ncbi:hypothetical protein [Thiothrix lacustris]|uniref:hypothetical protein n=1 Tax=Thiothrix lacustris TaxID=525917 RepID=UPI0027E4748B|nr:hypothetical protein [Thiothrix lacustris]WMP17645.1 hypothetical protein RCS87_00935 [Thiothrix lacustris]